MSYHSWLEFFVRKLTFVLRAKNNTRRSLQFPIPWMVWVWFQIPIYGFDESPQVQLWIKLPTPRGCTVTVPILVRIASIENFQLKWLLFFFFFSSGSLNQNFYLGSSSRVKSIVAEYRFPRVNPTNCFHYLAFRNACFRNMEEISWSITWSLVYYVLVFIKEK